MMNLRIKSLSIIDFGKFHQGLTFKDLNNKMVVFCGNNEAGKTTLFHLIKTLLYGFSPAKAQQHPYASWKNERIEFSAEIEVKGQILQLYRRLLSTPKGVLTTKDRIIDLKNQPAPFANHISSEIYNRIYSLRIEDLTALEGKAWDEVQDQLLANYGSTRLRDTKTVLKEIHEELNQLYRASGRGKYRVKELEEAIRELKKERSAAQERQALLRDHQKKMWQIKEQLQLLTEEQKKAKVLIKKTDQVKELYRLVKEKELLEKTVENPTAFEALPGDCIQLLREQEQRLKDLEQSLSRRIETQRALFQKQYTLSKGEQQILDSQAAIDSYYEKAIMLEGAAQELEQLEQEILRLQERKKNEEKNIFSEALPAHAYDQIRGLNIPSVRILGANIQKIKGQLQSLEIRMMQQTPPANGQPGTKAYIGILIMALGFLAIGIYDQSMSIILGAVVTCLYGVGSLIYHRRGKKKALHRQNEGYQGLAEERESRLVELKKALQELKMIFEGIPISQVLLENIDEALISQLMRLRDYLMELDQKSHILDEKKQGYHNKKLVIQEFLKAFAVDSRGTLKEQMETLRQHCQRLIQIQNSNDRIEELLQENERERALLQEEKEGLEQDIKNLKEGLSFLGDGDIQLGEKRFIDNKSIKMKIQSIDEKLQAIHDLNLRFLELEEIQRINPSLLTEEGQESLALELETLGERLLELKDQERELTIKSQELQGKMSLDEIGSRLMTLEVEKQQAILRRDQLMLLGEIIKRADESFREENQPDVLKTASSYLNRITGGRYSHIFLEEEEGETYIRLKGLHDPAPRRVGESFSKGTLNQLYIALRLSLIDHLDQRGEALPICFDELLINFDEERLDQYLALLKEVSEKRQIFIFTCHQWFAGKLKETFNVDPILL